LVLLTSSSGTNEESRLLIEVWRESARKFGELKFCQMQANLCIDGYPDRNTPTVLIYKDGQIVKQIVTLRDLRGLQTGLRGRLYWISIRLCGPSRLIETHRYRDHPDRDWGREACGFTTCQSSERASRCG
jgi:hypothetical protein